MPYPRIYEELARVQAGSTERITASAASMQQSTEHIRSSRKAIARSLRSLAAPFYNPVA